MEVEKKLGQLLTSTSLEPRGQNLYRLVVATSFLSHCTVLQNQSNMVMVKYSKTDQKEIGLVSVKVRTFISIWISTWFWFQLDFDFYSIWISTWFGFLLALDFYSIWISTRFGFLLDLDFDSIWILTPLDFHHNLVVN